MPNNLIVCGGTFDHFHKGHESFLNYALSLDKKLVVGITSDEYAGNSKIPTSLKLRGASKIQNSKLIENFEFRKKNLEQFLTQKKVSDRAEIIKIEDLFGPTLSRDLFIDAIVVSGDTKKGANIINRRRKKLGLVPLKVLVASPIEAEDGKLISSARIRNGEIDRMGKLYIKPAWLKKDLILPENLREEFRKPFGIFDFDVLEHQNQFAWIISVGDVTTKKLNQLNVDQKLSVIDFKVARKEAFTSFSDLGFSGNEKIITVKNPAGHITHSLFSIVLDIFRSVFNKRIILKITGEEDLAVLPLILAAPLDSIIYYGQPDTGLIKVLVSETNKEQAYNLASILKPI